MVDLKLTNSYSSMLFGTNGYQVVLMPMISPKAAEQAKRDKEAQEAEQTATQAATNAEKAEAVAEAETITKAVKARPKKHGRAKEPVAVA
jgi:hypothetical protein